MNRIADVVVIGGGVIGCSVAYYLAKKGAKVTVIEKKGGLCLGASGSNQGGCILTFEPPFRELARESVKLHENLSSEIGYDTEYRKMPDLLCSVDEQRYPDMEKQVQDLRRNGVNARLLEGDEIRELEPTLGKDIVSGIEVPDQAEINPFKLTYGLARAAGKLGTEFLLSTEVKKIETDKGKIASVVTDRGEIKTNFVVNAAGAWSPEIGKMVGITIPIRPQRGQIAVTEPAPYGRWRIIEDTDYPPAAFNKEEAVEISKEPRVKFRVAGTLLQESSGNWLIGSSYDFAGYNNAVTMQIIRCLVRRAIEFMPKLKGVNCIRAWAGLRPLCYVDGLPILSKVDNPSGFIIATGHGADGVALAPITGKLISELIIEKRTSIPIKAFAFSRFRSIKAE